METKLFNKKMKVAVPIWFPQTVKDWIRHACGGMPGNFFRSLVERDLHGVMSYADMTGRETLHGMWIMLYNGIPGPAWGSKENVKGWINLEEEQLEEVYLRWERSGDYEYWHDDQFEAMPIGVPDTQLFNMHMMHRGLETIITGFIEAISPEQYSQIVEAARAGSYEAAAALVEIIRNKSEVENGD